MLLRKLCWPWMKTRCPFRARTSARVDEADHAMERKPPQTGRAGDRRRGFGKIRRGGGEKSGDERRGGVHHRGRHARRQGNSIPESGRADGTGAGCERRNRAEPARRADTPRNRAGHGRQLLSAGRARRRPDESPFGDPHAGQRRRFASVRKTAWIVFTGSSPLALALLVAESLAGTRRKKFPATS